MRTETVKLFHGFLVNGLVVHHVSLNEVNGYDEQYVNESFNSSLPSFLIVTNLLKRVISDMNNKAQSEEILDQISIGDRNKLLLHLRRLTFGDRIYCTVKCPACAENLSLELSVKEIVSNLPPQPADYSVKVEDFLLQLRPLNGFGQKMLLELDRKYLTEKILRSCIISSEPTLPASGLTEDFVYSVASKLEEMDPLADPILNVNCPNCAHSFQGPLDVENIFLYEMSMLGKWLEQEVHWLAFNYHWSEESILSMPLTKRRKYIDLINKTLGGEQI